jgi:uncharacterized protein
MKSTLTHFAIHIDDMERAKEFYGEVFEWGFTFYGPSDFLQIKSDRSENGELIGALQSREHSPVKEKLIGLECTISVDNIDEIIKRVERKGGQVLVPKTAIPLVGWITKFLDTEGNLICAMEYNSNVI